MGDGAVSEKVDFHCDEGKLARRCARRLHRNAFLCAAIGGLFFFVRQASDALSAYAGGAAYSTLFLAMTAIVAFACVLGIVLSKGSAILRTVANGMYAIGSIVFGACCLAQLVGLATIVPHAILPILGWSVGEAVLIAVILWLTDSLVVSKMRGVDGKMLARLQDGRFAWAAPKVAKNAETGKWQPGVEVHLACWDPSHADGSIRVTYWQRCDEVEISGNVYRKWVPSFSECDFDGLVPHDMELTGTTAVPNVFVPDLLGEFVSRGLASKTA